MKSNLYQKLLENGKSDFYGFHMPGHKRNTNVAKMKNPFLFDITEIDGFDNLHAPKGIIKEEMDLAQEMYNSKGTYFLINGSSVGNLSAISAVAEIGDKIIIARNSHKSVYNAIELLKLKAKYIYPQIIDEVNILGSYNTDDIEKIIKENKDAKALVITSPTYEGIVSDVEKICDMAHAYNIPVIVDAAHGAHFIVSEEFPKTAVECGADIVVESLHKTLPSLTQTAILHYNSTLVNQAKVEKFLSMYQTSSPSYVLMASICNCLDFIRKDGNKYAEKLVERINMFKENVSHLKNISIFDGSYIVNDEKVFDFDISKIVILLNRRKDQDNWAKDMFSGIKLKNILNNKYHLEMEMAAGNYVLAMTSILDTDEGFARLEKGLKEIDVLIEEEINQKQINEKKIEKEREIKTETEIEKEAETNKKTDKKTVKKSDTDVDIKLEEYVSDSYIYMYPPGIPIVVPGEKVSVDIQKKINNYKHMGYEIIDTI